MYLAHECLTLGELRLFPLLAHLARLEPRAADASGDLDDDTEVESSADNLTLLRRTVSCSTFILVPQLRAAGTELLLVHLRQQRTVLSDYLKRTKGLKVRLNSLSHSLFSVSSVCYFLTHDSTWRRCIRLLRI